MDAPTFSPGHRRRLILDQIEAVAVDLGKLRGRIHAALDEDGNAMPAEQLWKLRRMDGDAESYRAEITRLLDEWEKVL